MAGEAASGRNEVERNKQFRRVLGHYPTGVSVIAATTPEGMPVGVTIGTFTSVSLDPPLVAFFPDRNSSSWPRIQRAARFCVNVLSADQEAVCRRFATKDADKFAGLQYRLSPLGSPIIDGTLAWIDCMLEDVRDAGDHYMVLGRVLTLEVESHGAPLVFCQGGFGCFSPRQDAGPERSR